MLPRPTVPASLAELLAVFRPLLTAPSYRTFCALTCGLITAGGRRTVTGMLTAEFAGRRLHAVGDAHYHGRALLGAGATVTTRLPVNAALFGPAPPRTGQRGRPRLKGQPLGRPAQIAATVCWTAAQVDRYG